MSVKNAVTSQGNMNAIAFKINAIKPRFFEKERRNASLILVKRA
jgi:hypothetical protein